MAPHLSFLSPVFPPPLTHILKFHTTRTTSPPWNRALSARIIYNSRDGNRLWELPSQGHFLLQSSINGRGTLFTTCCLRLFCVSCWLQGTWGKGSGEQGSRPGQGCSQSNMLINHAPNKVTSSLYLHSLPLISGQALPALGELSS